MYNYVSRNMHNSNICFDKVNLEIDFLSILECKVKQLFDESPYYFQLCHSVSCTMFATDLTSY